MGSLCHRSRLSVTRLGPEASGAAGGGADTPSTIMNIEGLSVYSSRRSPSWGQASSAAGGGADTPAIIMNIFKRALYAQKPP
eukprot:scaffold3517_cov110-Isochrysis_galbana.AAC.2